MLNCSWWLCVSLCFLYWSLVKSEWIVRLCFVCSYWFLLWRLLNWQRSYMKINAVHMLQLRSWIELWFDICFWQLAYISQQFVLGTGKNICWTYAKSNFILNVSTTMHLCMKSMMILVTVINLSVYIFSIFYFIFSIDVICDLLQQQWPF